MTMHSLIGKPLVRTRDVRDLMSRRKSRAYSIDHKRVVHRSKFTTCRRFRKNEAKPEPGKPRGAAVVRKNVTTDVLDPLEMKVRDGGLHTRQLVLSLRYCLTRYIALLE